MPKEAIIELNGLVAGYHRKQKVVPVMSFPDMKVAAGDFIAIAGPNGIGKSTLIKTLVQLIPEISGQIMLGGKPVSAYTRIELATLVSYVSTEMIHSRLSVRELVSFGRYPYTNWFGRIGEEDMRIVDEAVAMLELEALAHRNIDEISDGERQKAMIARALAQQTEIVILDEPTAFLDLPHKYEIVNLLGRLSREFGKTVLFTTHDLGIAIREVDKLWILSGNGFFHGSPEDLILDGTIAKTFHTPRVLFDNRKGEFTVKKTLRPYFFITGKNIAVHWTRNAIEKDGFTVIDKPVESQPAITVEQTPTGYQWMVELNRQTTALKSISELRAYIRENFGRKN